MSTPNQPEKLSLEDATPEEMQFLAKCQRIYRNPENAAEKALVPLVNGMAEFGVKPVQ